MKTKSFVGLIVSACVLATVSCENAQPVDYKHVVEGPWILESYSEAGFVVASAEGTAVFIGDQARSFAIRVRKVGSGAVDGSSSRIAWNGGASRPQGETCAATSAVSRTCSANAVINGDADAYGSSRPNR